MTETIFKNKKWNPQKALGFGFLNDGIEYQYTAVLADGQMEMTVTVTDENIGTRITDVQSGEEYVLHLVPGASGAFVGQVKTEYEAVLERIAETCFDPDIFKSGQANEIIAYVRETYGDELEFLWKKFPDNAIWRRPDNQKWYGALLTVSRRKLGFDSDEKAEIIDLRMAPEQIETAVDGIRILPGYHMNKKHWITVCLDGTVPTEEIYELIGESYRLALKQKGNPQC